jgi:lipoyl(octanoyl) transferase
MESGAWDFMDSGARNGAFNMALDEALARRLQSGTGSPLLRLFRWSPWAVSLGYNQNPEDVDTAACRRDGIDVVRRPTGGRAILHAEELTYSVVMFAGRRSVLDVYNAISGALVRGLALHGVSVSLQKSQPNFPETYRHASAIPCFTSSARYEIEWKGRKLVGSAQRRFSGGAHDVVLQHGSILCGPAHLRLADYVRVEAEPILERLRRELTVRTVDLSEIEQHSVDIPDLAASIRKGFELEWGIRFTEHSSEVIADSALDQVAFQIGR